MVEEAHIHIKDASLNWIDTLVCALANGNGFFFGRINGNANCKCRVYVWRKQLLKLSEIPVPVSVPWRLRKEVSQIGTLCLCESLRGKPN